MWQSLGRFPDRDPVVLGTHLTQRAARRNAEKVTERDNRRAATAGDPLRAEPEIRRVGVVERDPYTVPGFTERVEAYGHHSD